MNYSSLLCTDSIPAEEAAEAYVFRQIPEADLERYEEHLLVCPRCQDAVRQFDVFLSTVRLALAQRPNGKSTTPRTRAKSASC
jgi:hypothetical protein